MQYNLQTLKQINDYFELKNIGYDRCWPTNSQIFK